MRRPEVSRLVPRPATSPSPVADFTPRPDVKWGHFLAFAALAWALTFAFPTTRRDRVFIALILFGISIEMVQGFSITRSPEPSDVVRDGLGAAAGLIFAISWQFLRRFRRTDPS
jgi:VanZ family protein